MKDADLPPAVRDFVANARVGHLATVDSEGRPHVVPFCFVLSGNTVYSPLDEKPKNVRPEGLKRVRNLLVQPQVQVLVDRYDEDWERLAFVQLRGRARLVDGGNKEHEAALRLLRAKYSQYEAMALEGRPVIAIDVTGHFSWAAGASGESDVPKSGPGA